MKVTKVISISTIVWLIAFFADNIYELFQINKTSVVETITGVQIKTVMTDKKLDTVFSLTIKTAVIYVSFVVICLVIYYLWNKLLIARRKL